MVVKILRLILIVAVLVALQACPTSQNIEIFNNSSNDFFIQYKDSSREIWRRSEIMKLDDDRLGNLTWIKDASTGLDSPVIDLSAREDNVRYAMSAIYSLPKEYSDARRGLVVVAAQIEPDGRIYAVDPGGAWPRALARPQPLGFPISPMKVLR